MSFPPAESMNDDDIREFVDEWYYANVLPNPEFSIDDCVQMIKDFQAALLPRKQSERINELLFDDKATRILS